MQNRHSLEIALSDAINQQDVETASTLIEIIHSKTQGPSLSSCDEEGDTFLHLSLKVGAKALVDKLLDLKCEDDSFLFAENKDKQNVGMLAAQCGYEDVVAYFVKRTMAVIPGNLGYQWWLKSDGEGNALLSYAVTHRQLAVVKYLLTLLTSDHAGVNHLNRFNLRKNTPLHQALFAQTHAIDMEIVSLLIQAGADFTLANDNNETPLSLLCQLPFSVQVELFSKLDKMTQNKLLQHYRARLLSQPQLDKQVYYTLAGLHGLQTLAAAKLEFDDEVEIRNFYNKADGKEAFVPDHILDLAPLYAMRVCQAEGLVVVEIGGQTKNTELALANYQLLNDDTINFAALLTDVEGYLADLKNRPAIPFSTKTMAALTSVLVLLVYVGIETWLALMGGKSFDFDNPNRRDYFSYETAAVGFGLGAPFIFAYMAVLFSNRYSNDIKLYLETRIDRNEWKALLDKVRADVLDKLQTLEEMEVQAKVDCLPVPVQTIRDLEGHLADFDAEIKPLHEVIDMLQRLDAVLLIIQQGMLLTNKPLSLFFKPAHEVINVQPPFDESSDEQEWKYDPAARLLP